MTRYFTLAQAEQLLPEVERALRNLLLHRAEYQQAEREMARISERIRTLGGVRIDPGEVMAIETRKGASGSAMQDGVEELDRLGAQLKDVETGLIDFPARFRNQDVCLCWKLGEPGIAFWHGVEEGFRGRKPIDQEFLNGHSGGEGGKSGQLN